jgi:hypothetical protein
VKLGIDWSRLCDLKRAGKDRCLGKRYDNDGVRGKMSYKNGIGGLELLSVLHCFSRMDDLRGWI